MEISISVEEAILGDIADASPDECDVVLHQGLKISRAGGQPSTSRREAGKQRIEDFWFPFQLILHE